MYDLKYKYDINQHINKEFFNQKTIKDKRNFIENMRFLMLTGDDNFQNYYSNKTITTKEFYSIIDNLYDLDNFLMLSSFIQKNQMFLFYGMEKLLNEEGKLDFQEIYRLEENIMLKRLSHVLKLCSINKSYNKEKGNMSFERKKIKSL